MTKQIYLPSDGPAGTPSIRTLGTGAQQAAVGSHTHAHSAITGIGTDDHHAQLHAAAHDPGGADALHDPTRLLSGPAINSYLAWTCDPYMLGAGQVPCGAGIVQLSKLMTSYTYVINTIDLHVKVAGTGVQPLVNCFVGIYDSGGTRRFVSADQSSAWATTGPKNISLGGTPYTVTANDFIYIALLVGTQSTTAVQFVGPGGQTATIINVNLTAAAYRCGSQNLAASALPASLTLSSNSSGTMYMWYGVR